MKTAVSAAEAVILGTLIILSRISSSIVMLEAVWVILICCVVYNGFCWRGYEKLFWILALPFALLFWATVLCQWLHA
jgi:hypothetical protein